jgi:Holliday junction resolvasome RuvABC endonuclease subunit
MTIRAAEAEGDYSFGSVRWIGVDVGTKGNLAIVGLSGDGNVVFGREPITLEGKTLIDRAIHAGRIVAECCMKYPEADWAFEEPPAVHGNIKTYKALIQVLTAMELQVAIVGLWFEEYMPQTVKSVFAGNGRAKKAGVKSVAALEGFSVDDQNVIDAYAVARTLMIKATSW